MKVKFSKGGRAPLFNFILGRPKYIGRYIGKTTRKSSVFVKFNNNCTYNGGVSDKLNILFGYTLGGSFRTYVGWRYVVSTGRIELYLSAEDAGKYTYQRFISSMDLNTGYYVDLHIDVIRDTITAKITKTLNQSLSFDAKIENVLGRAPLGMSYCMSPKLNINCFPEKEMEITLERIR